MNKIQVLVFAANPKGTDSLQLDKEIRDLKEGIRQSKYHDKFDFKIELAVRSKDMRGALIREKPDIVHFSGHGAKQGIVLEDDYGNPVVVSAGAISDLFKEFKDHVGCVLLNACYSEFQAKAIQQHIDYVVGMNDSISDKAAIEFSIGFYDALGAGKSFKKSFNFGRVAAGMISESELNVPILLTRERKLNLPDKVMQELGLSFTSKLMKVIGMKQRELLHVIENCLSAPSSDMVNYDEIFNRCDQNLKLGLYYRLEQLRLLGFIEKEQVDVKNGMPIYSYFLSEEYRNELARS